MIDENFFLTVVKGSNRIIDLTEVANYILQSLNCCEVSKEALMNSLIGFHSFSGCGGINLLEEGK